MNIWRLVMLSVAILYLSFVIMARFITMHLMNPAVAQMLFSIYASPLIAMHDMWRNLRSLPERWEQERDQQEFFQFFGFPPGWSLITQKLVDERLDLLALSLLEIREHDHFAPAGKRMEQYFRRVQEVAERCGYVIVILSLEEHFEMAAQKRQGK